MTIGHVDVNVSAEDTGTAILTTNSRNINVTVDIGDFVGTVTLQRRFNSATAVTPPTPFIDVETYTAGTNKFLVEVESNVEYRLFVKTGDYTSGTAYLRLSF